MEAIDPRALLSGHYVIIDLRERLDPGEPCPTPTTETAWLALAPNGEHNGAVYSFAGAAPAREDVPTTHGAILVQGEFRCTEPTGGLWAQPGWVALHLGFDRFYLNQTDAERIERILREQRPEDATRVYAIVSIGDDGVARLKGLLVDGRRIEPRLI
jgi:hypothetical protein